MDQLSADLVLCHQHRFRRVRPHDVCIHVASHPREELTSTHDVQQHFEFSHVRE